MVESGAHQEGHGLSRRLCYLACLGLLFNIFTLLPSFLLHVLSMLSSECCTKLLDVVAERALARTVPYVVVCDYLSSFAIWQKVFS